VLNHRGLKVPTKNTFTTRRRVQLTVWWAGDHTADRIMPASRPHFGKFPQRPNVCPPRYVRAAGAPARAGWRVRGRADRCAWKLHALCSDVQLCASVRRVRCCTGGAWLALLSAVFQKPDSVGEEVHSCVCGQWGFSGRGAVSEPCALVRPLLPTSQLFVWGVVHACWCGANDVRPAHSEACAFV
jgi:hypothetical protein